MGDLHSIRRCTAPGGNEPCFRAGGVWSCLPAVEMKLAEARYVRTLEALREREAAFPELTGESLSKNYPGSGQCITQVLHSADAKAASLVKE